MSWANFLKLAATGVGTALGGPVGGALAGGLTGMIASRGHARGMEQAGAAAGQNAMQGFNYLSGSPIGQQYLTAGGAAAQQQQALLGIGGDPAAAQEAYQQYQNSTGYQGQLQAGEQAITGSAAARGMLGSGSTLKALTGYGQQLGAQSFNNYLGQLGGVAGMGLQAGGMLGQAASAGGAQAGQYAYGAGMGAAGARASGWDQLIGGVGGALDGWNQQRTPRMPGQIMQPVDPSGQAEARN